MLNEIIKKTKERLEIEKKEFPFEWLGRSLAYNPFMPKEIKNYIKKGFVANIDSSADILQSAVKFEKDGADCLWIDSSAIQKNVNVEEISQIRRYVSLPIIRFDYILDKYQILQSLVYGADGVVLNPSLTDSISFKKLGEYVFHLGLEPIIEIPSKKYLLTCVSLGADFFYISSEDEVEKIISSLPKKKYIILNDKNAKNIQNEKVIILRKKNE